MKSIFPRNLHLVALLGVAALAAAETPVAPSGNQPSEQVQAIHAVAQAWVARYNSGDAAGVADLYAPDGYYVSAHVLAHGRAAIEKYWAQGITAGGHLDFVRPVEVHVEGSLGYFLGKYQATNAGVTVDGRIVIVAKRIDGRWRIAVHETVVRDQPG